MAPIVAGATTTLAIASIVWIATFAPGIGPVAQASQHASTSGSPGSVGAGHLVLDAGSAGIALHAGPLGGKLYDAHFRGSSPEVQVLGGTVTVRQRREGGSSTSSSGSQSASSSSWHASWTSSSSSTWSSTSGGSSVSSSTSSSLTDSRADITLNDSIPWAVTARGGTAGLEADLRTIRVSGIDVAGGAAGVELTLPRPSGTVPLRFSGGVSRLVLHLEQGTAVQVHLSGGGAGVTLLHDEHAVVVGDLRWSSPGYDSASGRYDVEISGGWAGVTVDTTAG